MSRGCLTVRSGVSEGRSLSDNARTWNPEISHNKGIRGASTPCLPPQPFPPPSPGDGRRSPPPFPSGSTQNGSGRAGPASLHVSPNLFTGMWQVHRPRLASSRRCGGGGDGGGGGSREAGWGCWMKLHHQSEQKTSHVFHQQFRRGGPPSGSPTGSEELV